jgi:hypothetical protein
MNYYLNTASVIEFIGAIIIAISCLKAVFSILKGKPLEVTKAYIANGSITALDFKLAATLLKILTLVEWNKIGIFASTYAIRLILKKNFYLEAKNNNKTL